MLDVKERRNVKFGYSKREFPKLFAQYRLTEPKCIEDIKEEVGVTDISSVTKINMQFRQ
jgi:hypothetical protein